MIRMARCRSCGKEFVVLYPDLWRYRDGNKWFCSWGCLRADEKGERKEAKGKVNRQMEIARELAEAMERGEDAIGFLKEKGYTNPERAYTNIKAKAAEDPELAARFPDRRKVKKTEVTTVAQVPEVKVSGELRIASDEPEKVELIYDPSIEEEYRREQAAKCTKPLTNDDYETTAIRKPGIGEFYYDRRNGTID